MTHQRLVRRVCLPDAGLRRQAGFPRGFDDQLPQPVAPPPSRPSAWAYSFDQAFEALLVFGRDPPLSAVAADGRWVTAAMRRLACAASPGLETIKG